MLPCTASGQTAGAPPAAPQQGSAPPPERYFQPPPMPDFMLRRPERPLTQDEMQKQADEAAARVRPPQAPDATGVRAPQAPDELSKKDKELQGEVK